MKAAVFLLLLFSGAGYGQNAKAPSSWRENLAAVPAAPPTTTTARDIAAFEKNMRMAASYLGQSAPDASSAQWEANRAMVRRMATYLYGLRALSGDRHFRGAVDHAQHSFDSLGFGAYLYALGNAQTYPPPDAPQPQDFSQQQPNEAMAAAPFALSAPEPNQVSEADKSVAAELRTRYETDAAHAAGIWANGETLRQNLALRGMGLNLETSTAMARLPQLFRSAATALRNSDWDGARSHLERAEAEAAKIAKTVGR